MNGRLIDVPMELIAAGGVAGTALVLLSVVMWTCVGVRAAALWSIHADDGRSDRARAARAETLGTIVHALAASATLLGLLGTVAGMVETFDAMQTSTFHTGAERSMAGGISVALVSTQLGLVVGIPGLVAARILDRVAQRRLANERTAWGAS